MTSVSVVIPTYNRRDTLVRAIESLFAQDHPVSEVIVVDDGSTDGTAELPLLGDPRVHYLVNPTNLGAQGARNRGVAAATGDAIAFLDSDDYWEPTKLSKQLAAVAAHGSPDNYAVTCGYSQFGETGGFSMKPAELIRLEDVVVHNLIGPTSILLVSRNIFDLIGPFDLAMPACQDYELFVRILQHVPIFGVPEILVHQDTESNERITRRKDKVLAGHREVYARIRATPQVRAMPFWRRWMVKARQDRALRKRMTAIEAGA
ncbi:glycosyltransferase family 2 protein [Sphingomonas montanisoli]|nr:glycosyltransferase family 2 protein [Sphingomonas montanisoli]